ncbi:unnamed protein product [marine sediment metagenome]|uniref:Flagellar assembly protein FliH/Type III secretion system HrpE domain-containing protein n=1 Tax=marine sediment metagenome TaxID=412755 RepID=X0S2G5_9ZZZZ
MSDNSEKVAENGNSWTKLEMESFESPPLPKKKDKTNFVSLQIGGGETANFIPLEESGDNYKKRKEAEDILKQAQEKADLLEREAYEKGFAQGEKDGIELGEKKVLKVIENIENFFIEMSHLKKEILKQYEKGILDLIFAIAEKIVHRKIESDERIVKDIVLKAFELASEKSKIMLRVNPEDFDYIERLKPEFFSKFKDLKSIIVTSDPSITRGGCFLETPYGDLDATVETQLEKIYQSLEGGVFKIEN